MFPCNILLINIDLSKIVLPIFTLGNVGKTRNKTFVRFSKVIFVIYLAKDISLIFTIVIIY